MVGNYRKNSLEQSGTVWNSLEQSGTVWSSRGYWGCVWAPVEKVDLGLGVKEFSEFWDALKNCDGLYFGYGKEPTEWETLG